MTQMEMIHWPSKCIYFVLIRFWNQKPLQNTWILKIKEIIWEPVDEYPRVSPQHSLFRVSQTIVMIGILFQFNLRHTEYMFFLSYLKHELFVS